MIGTIVSFVLNQINSNNPDQEYRFTNSERIGLIVLWPLSIATFVFYFIKSWFK